jgi:hypothetical protein
MLDTVGLLDGETANSHPPCWLTLGTDPILPATPSGSGADWKGPIDCAACAETLLGPQSQDVFLACLALRKIMAASLTLGPLSFLFSPQSTVLQV